MAWALPASLLALLLGAWLLLAGPKTITGVRVFGGPVVGATHLSWRVALLTSRSGVVAALPEASPQVSVHIEVQQGGRSLVKWSGRTDRMGMAFPELELSQPVEPTHPLTLSVATEDQPPRKVPVTPLTPESWPVDAGAGIQGVHRSGELTLEVLPEFAVFAAPFAQAVAVEVSRAGVPTPALVEFQLEGRGTVEPSRQMTTLQDGREQAVFRVTLQEHALQARVVARDDTQEAITGQWYARLPVVPGALAVTWNPGGELQVESAVGLERAYVAVINQDSRLWGAALDLTPTASGGSVAQVVLPPRVAQVTPLWAVVSSDADLRSPAAVGWPIGPGHSTPRVTRTVADALLADTLTPALAQAHAAERATWVGLTAAALLSGLGLSGWMLLMVRRADRELSVSLKHAGQNGRMLDPQRGRGRLYAALLCAFFAALALWLLLYW